MSVYSSHMRAAGLLLVLGLLPDVSPPRGVDFTTFEQQLLHENWYSHHVSPSGDLFAVLQGAKIRLIDVRTAREVRVLEGHAAEVHDLGWSQDGRTLASTAMDGIVLVWEVPSGRTLLSLKPHPGYT